MKFVTFENIDQIFNINVEISYGNINTYVLRKMLLPSIKMLDKILHGKKSHIFTITFL